MDLFRLLNPLLLYRRWQLSRVRLGRVLRRRHVDVGLYLDETGSAGVARQLVRCRRCTQTARCDRTVMSLGAALSRYAFCPNVATLDRFSDTAGLRPNKWGRALFKS